MRRSVSAFVVLALSAWALTACAARAPAPVSAVPAARAPASALAAVRAPVISALPARATIAWVEPLVLVAEATTEDNESVTLGAVRSMRLDVEALLKNQQWTFMSGDTAQYVATIALVRRTVQREERRVVPGTENLPRRCDSTRSGSVCSQPPPSYETVRVPVTETKAVFVLRRREDGARHELVVSHFDARTSGGEIVKRLIALLRAR